MTDKPIIFSGAMVNALLSGRKTMTRRVLKPQPHPDLYPTMATISDGMVIFRNQHTGVRQDIRCPYAIGDRLWVRESTYLNFDTDNIYYSADNHGVGNEIYRRLRPLMVGGVSRFSATTKGRPSIHMNRFVSRLTLTVTDVKVERLLDISWIDAIAEGIKDPRHAAKRIDLTTGPVGKFRDLWDSLNASPKPAKENGRIASYVSYPWGGEPRTETYRGLPHVVVPNPWIVAPTFTVAANNIDRREEK